MIKFHKTVNDKEQFLGCYISTTVLNKQSMAIVQYFIELLNNKIVKSPLVTPIVLMFDPELTNNKLDIKVSIHRLIFNLNTLFYLNLGVEHPLDLSSEAPNAERIAIQVQPRKLREIRSGRTFLRSGVLRY